MSESNRDNDNPITCEALLTPAILHVINNDNQYQLLLQKRVDLHNIAIPKIIKTHEGIYKQLYSDEFYESLHRVNTLISQRQWEIFNDHPDSKNPHKNPHLTKVGAN